MVAAEPPPAGSRPKIVDLRHDNIINQPTAVHCEKDVKCWACLRSIVALVVHCCRCKASSSGEAKKGTSIHQSEHHHRGGGRNAHQQLGSVVTGTIFGHRKGKVTMCIQEDPRGPPVMLLELAMPTFLLVKEMSSGLLRIAMECEKDETMKKPLYSEPVWSMFCNGRKVGFAVRKPFSDGDRAVLGLMQSVSMGAGVIPLEDAGHGEEDDLMYMRATYERVVGSPDSESFHMINPDGSPGQELSIFLMRA